jgi:MFS transporter, DHA2 family, multidrug resistance protein
MEGLTTARRRAILLTLTVTVGTYVLTVTVANVSLPQMQGTFAATQDQITWVVTSNLLATAVATPLSGWLNARFGRRRVMLWCAVIFTVFSTLCGLAGSLGELVFYRAVQGFSGAPLLPLSQAIILESYPREQHGRVFVLWSLGVTLGSIIGPILGGYASEGYSWRWVFLMITPLALFCIAALWVYVEDTAERLPQRAFDWSGFVLLALAVSSLQLMLDRGERLDWFDSREIVLEAVLASAAFYLFVVHVLTTDKPFLDPKLLLDRNYAVGALLGFVFGMLYFTTLVLQPSMLQGLRGYPDSMIGILQGLRGVGLAGGSIVVLILVRWLDPRHSILLGFLFQGLAGFAMAKFNVNMTTWAVAWTTMLQGFGIGLIWSPITVVTFATLAPRHMAEAASVFHLLRNIGSTVHIALSAALVVRTGRASYAEMVEVLNPFNERLDFHSIVGGWQLGNPQGLAAVSREVSRQASMIGYVNAYYAYALLAMLVLPLVFLAKRPVRAV